MDKSVTSPAGTQFDPLVDEIEQLRTSLETALEENAALVAERDGLRRRIEDMGQEARQLQAALVDPFLSVVTAEETVRSVRSETEEELRVAFEELQVVTEELEVANTSLQLTNQQLDARVEQRTRELNETNATLRSTEAALQAIADLVPELLGRTDAHGHADWFNQRWFAVTGQTRNEALGLGWFDAIHPADQADARAKWDAAIAGCEPYQHEHRLEIGTGGFRWILVRAEPLRDQQGRIVRWFIAGTDIHENRAALEAMQRSERRFRTLVEGMPQLVWRAVDGGRRTWSSPQWCAYTGQQMEDTLVLGWLDALHPDDRARAAAMWDRAQDRGILDMEGRIYHAEEARYRHFRTRALPVHDEAGAVVEWLGTSTDVDDILQMQEEQTLLVAELQHRTRNLMAVVQAVTARTLRGTSSLEQFAQCIDDRFSALARVQGLLSRRENGSRVAFDNLLREELSAHVELTGQGGAEQVLLEGPDGVRLKSAVVQTFALALHELATNAVKYGALSRPEGRLRIRWHVEQDEQGNRHLCVDWRESGISDMPEAGASARGGGYGRELIERALPYQLGARTSYSFEADGVHCTIKVIVPPEEIDLEKING